jgi:hypothetical protein
MSASGTSGTVTFSLNHEIEAGSTSRLLMRGNIASAAGAGTYALNIAASGVTAEDTDSASATIAGLATGPRTVTIAGNGTFAERI